MSELAGQGFSVSGAQGELSDSDVWPEVSEEARPWGLAGPLRVALFRKQHGAAGAESARGR